MRIGQTTSALCLCRRYGAIDLAALYTAGIVRNHPFIEGNKRTGFVPGILFLN